MNEDCNHKFVTTYEETHQYTEHLNGYEDRYEVYEADETCSKCGIYMSRFGKTLLEGE